MNRRLSGTAAAVLPNSLSSLGQTPPAQPQTTPARDQPLTQMETSSWIGSHTGHQNSNCSTTDHTGQKAREQTEAKEQNTHLRKTKPEIGT